MFAMRTHLDSPKISNPLSDKFWHRLVWVWSVDLVDLVRHGKVTIYDGAMFHKAGRFEMILKLHSFCERIFKLHMFDHGCRAALVYQQVYLGISCLLFCGGDPCTTVDTW